MRAAVQSMVRLVPHAERLGLARLRIAEHHNMKNLASSAAAPYLILGANAIAADSDEEAQMLTTTRTQIALGSITNAQQKLQKNDRTFRRGLGAWFPSPV